MKIRYSGNKNEVFVQKVGEFFKRDEIKDLSDENANILLKELPAEFVSAEKIKKEDKK